MDKFLFASLLEEVYREILYITYHYQEEMIGEKEIKALGSSDFNNLSKSKVLFNYYDLFSTLDENDSVYVEKDFLDILRSKNYDKDNTIKLINYLNPYVELYIDKMHEMIDIVSDVLDIKMKEDSYKGEYPIYIKIEKDKASIIRAILSTNASQYLNKETKKFGFKVTYVEYKIPLKEYSYNGIDLREKDKKEIIDIMDSSVKVNLNNAQYDETNILEYKTDGDHLKYQKGEISQFLDKKKTTYNGIKSVMKDSLKRSLITLGILALVTILILIFKYLK